MAACLYRHTGPADTAECFHINLGGSQQCFAQATSQTVIVRFQRFFCHLKYLPHQGKAIAVYTRGRHADEYVSCLQVLSGDQVLFIYDPHRESGQIVFVFRIKARHLRGLSADQRGIRLPAALRNPAYDGRDLLRFIFAACNVIQEKQRFTACAGNVVDTHRHTVDPHRIVPVHEKRQLQLCPHTVRTGYQSRLFHLFKPFHGECSGKTAQVRQNLRAHRPLHMLLHQFHCLIAGLNVHAGSLVIYCHCFFSFFCPVNSTRTTLSAQVAGGQNGASRSASRRAGNSHCARYAS